MSVRSRMTMRATVTRDVTESSQNWNTEEAAELVEVGVVPCRVWSKQRREKDDVGKDAIIEDLRAHVPATADIKDGDRLVIRDRKDLLLFDGPVYVKSVARKSSPGSRAHHQELMLTRHL